MSVCVCLCVCLFACLCDKWRFLVRDFGFVCWRKEEIRVGMSNSQEALLQMDGWNLLGLQLTKDYSCIKGHYKGDCVRLS